MRIAVIGSSGQLGVDLLRVLAETGGPWRETHEAIGFSGRAELDICDAAAFSAMLARHKPQAIINTAAFHNVDLCEKETDAAYRTNVIAVREMAKACEAAKMLFFQIGTDYVFGGEPSAGTLPKNAPSPRPLSESAPVSPNSIYSLTRFGGDCMTLAHAPQFGYVVRSCGLFGVAGCKLKGGLNFVDTMIKAAREGKKLRVVDDQTVAPTPTDDLAKQLRLMIEHSVSGPLSSAVSPQSSVLSPGLYHAVAHGEVTWYAFAKRSLELAGLKQAAAEMEPVPSTAYAAPAKRPGYSVLDNTKLRTAGLDIMGSWEEGLKRFIAAKYNGTA